MGEGRKNCQHQNGLIEKDLQMLVSKRRGGLRGMGNQGLRFPDRYPPALILSPRQGRAEFMGFQMKAN